MIFPSLIFFLSFWVNPEIFYYIQFNKKSSKKNFRLFSEKSQTAQKYFPGSSQRYFIFLKKKGE